LSKRVEAAAATVVVPEIERVTEPPRGQSGS
jgi:hypothetical protein